MHRKCFFSVLRFGSRTGGPSGRSARRAQSSGGRGPSYPLPHCPLSPPWVAWGEWEGTPSAGQCFPPRMDDGGWGLGWEVRALSI